MALKFSYFFFFFLHIQVIKCKGTESIQWAWDKANELAYYQGVLNWQFFNRNDLGKRNFFSFLAIYCWEYFVHAKFCARLWDVCMEMN
jgi:hypothetical protein